MILNSSCQRRVFLRLFTSSFLIAAAPLSLAQTNNNATLTIVVTGNDKPIPQAEVKISFDPSFGRDLILLTNESGEAIFNPIQVGTARVRVIVPAWEGVLRELNLAQGAQVLIIRLKPFAATK